MKTRKQIIILSSLLLFLVLVIFLFRGAGTYLIKADPVHKADAMVMLMGGIAPDRILESVDTYKKGLSGRLIIVQENMGAYKQLEEKGAHIISNTQQACNAAIALGIPADSVTILPGDAQSTQQEAVIIRSYLKTQPEIQSINLVSSSDHTRRATMIFKKAFEKQHMPVTVYSCPSKYSSYTGKGWWKNKEGIQTVLMEYLKMMNFWLFDKSKL